MKKKLLFLLLMFVSFSSYAKQQTLTLSVPTLNCASCPFTVKLTLKRVEGITKAEVSFQTKQAVVTYDDNKVSVGDLVKATANAGYPSTVVKKIKREKA